MLIQHRLNIQSDLRVQLLHIRERELDYFLHNLRAIAQLAMLLSGFGHSGLIYLKYIDFNLCGEKEYFCAEFTYPFTIILVIGFSLMTQWGCLLVMMLAPHMAIHGATGSFSKSVDLTEREIQGSLRLLALSVWTFLLAGAMWAFQSQWVSSAVFITVVILLSMWATREVVAYLTRVFKIDRKQLVTGKMQFRRRRRKAAGQEHRKGGHGHHHGQHHYTALNDEYPDPPSSTTSWSSTVTSHSHSHRSDTAATKSPLSEASQPRLPWYGQLQRTAHRTVGVVERTARAVNNTFLYNEEACMAQDPRIAPSASSSHSRARAPRNHSAVRARPAKRRPAPGPAHCPDSTPPEREAGCQSSKEHRSVVSPPGATDPLSAERAAHGQAATGPRWLGAGCDDERESAHCPQRVRSPSPVHAFDRNVREPRSRPLSAELNATSGSPVIVPPFAACESAEHARTPSAASSLCRSSAQHCGSGSVLEDGSEEEERRRLTAVAE